MRPNLLGADEALRRIADGRLSCVELMQAYCDEIERREVEVRAWVHLDKQRALAAARRADNVERSRRGPLHGLPIGVKDLFDTADFPTEWGNNLWKGRRTEKDAVAIELLTQAGAIVIGKTVTTEYGLLHPGPTRNPHNLLHTPGGSSSGSAAAVAAHMAAFALASQTNASTIRPASYCGVYGFKPSFGLVPRTGLARIAATLDVVGLYARDIPGLARALQVLVAADPQDPHNRAGTLTGLDKAISHGPKRRWRIGVVRTPVWALVEPQVRSLIEGFVERLAKRAAVIDIGLPTSFRRAHQEHLVIQDHGVSAQLYSSYVTAPGSFSAETTEMILRGRNLSSVRVNDALEWQQRMTAQMDDVLSEVDVAITAAATGEAPATLEKTGNPQMSTIWSLTGTPALAIPWFTGQHGLPVGLQIVARRDSDADVLGFATFLERERTCL